MSWQWPFVSRRNYEAVFADRERIRGERNQFEQDRNAARAATRTAARQFAEADSANRRLEGRVLELGRRISRLTEADPEYTVRLEQRVARLRAVGVRILTAYAAEKARADQAAALVDADDRKAVETWEQRAKTADAWTPGEWEARPIDGAAGRPLHPAVELRRALERCRLLEQRLTVAEARRRGVA